MSQLGRSFSALSANQKATFLARVAHEATIDARAMAYGQDCNQPDGLLLREINEFAHRVTGYIPHVLDGTEGVGQDASVMEMIVQHFRAHGREHRLVEWLRIPN
jgi:hypothetical protein